VNEEEIQQEQALINYYNWKYEEECRNRVHPVALVAVGSLILYIAIFIIASVLYCTFG